MRRRIVLSVGIGATILVTSHASAQEANADLARKLFESGYEASERNDWANACPLFRASLLLVQRASARYFTAKCDELDGKLVLALRGYQEAIDQNQKTANDATLDQEAQSARQSLLPKIPSITIAVAPAPPDLQVKCDGQDVPLDQLGKAVQVDPGEHVIVATAPSYFKRRATVTTSADGKVAPVSLRLERVVPEGTGPLPVPAPVGRSRESPVPTWAWVSGALGVASIGAGFAFLADDITTISALRTLCSTMQTTGGVIICAGATAGPGASLNARKDRDFPLLMGFFAAGGLGIGAAIIGPAMARTRARPDDARTTAVLGVMPWIALGGGGAVVRGRF